MIIMQLFFFCRRKLKPKFKTWLPSKKPPILRLIIKIYKFSSIRPNSFIKLLDQKCSCFGIEIKYKLFLSKTFCP